jgi:thiamine thiazole synthase
MMMNKIVVQDEARGILEEFGIRNQEHEKGYHVAESLEAISALSLEAIRAGCKIFNLISAEDLMVKKDRVTGLVVNWGAVVAAKLHVDPLTIGARSVIDATGHAAELCRVLERKTGAHLATESGRVVGERSMDAEVGERLLMDNTRSVYPGLYVCGMASNAVFGGPRMGPIFGGMLLSGRQAAELIMGDLG